MKALLICPRDPSDAELADEDVALLDALLTPDNLVPKPPRIRHEHGVTSVLFNPPSSVEALGASFCLGKMAGAAGDWARPGSALPDGSYALARVDAATVELAADAVASRTMWFLMTERVFAASTSQRALVALCRSFEPNRKTFTWMLSSGTLGPEGGWDVRLRSVAAGARVRLDRAAWRLHVEEPFIAFAPLGASEAGHRRRLEGALDAVFEDLSFDYSKWILPLSGGFDSRGLLLLLEKRRGLECVTWGTERSLDEPRNDAHIAARLARRMNVAHRFFPIAVADVPRRRLVDRFLVAGEGRTDRVSGYLDGFAMWRTFAEQGRDGVIRGDEAFGWVPVRREADVRHADRLTVLDDTLDTEMRAAFELPEREVPARLQRRAGESLAAWRDRVYQQYSLPVLLAALTDLKCTYVEVVNPLLFGSVIDCVRTLPDRLRTDKRLWRNIVARRTPPIPFAKRTAVYPLKSFVADPATLELMLEELAPAGDVLGADFAAGLRRNVDERWASGRDGARGRGRVRPRRLERLLGRMAGRLAGTSRRVDPLILAFRAFLIARTCALFASDARALGSARPRAASGFRVA
jgi:hypothetical protein